MATASLLIGKKGENLTPESQEAVVKERNEKFKSELDSIWQKLNQSDKYNKINWDTYKELKSIIDTTPRHGSTILVHPLDLIQ